MNRSNKQTEMEMEMEKHQEKSHLQLSQVQTFFKDGIRRIYYVFDSDEFTFVVNSSCFASTIIESVLLSLSVEELIHSDSRAREFLISDEDIVSSDFFIVLVLIWSLCRSKSSSNSSQNPHRYRHCNQIRSRNHFRVRNR
jgi:hypothetical protein